MNSYGVTSANICCAMSSGISGVPRVKRPAAMAVTIVKVAYAATSKASRDWRIACTFPNNGRVGSALRNAAPCRAQPDYSSPRTLSGGGCTPTLAR